MVPDRPYAKELGEFLRARRGRLRPQDVGLEPGGRRKVSGLRREELALLAGLSTDYYQRMEQGREVRPSDDILDALAAALGLDDTGRRHLFALARAARRPASPSREPEIVPESTRRLLRTMGTPALVLGRHLDVLDYNEMAETLFGSPGEQRNMLILLFQDPAIKDHCPDWEAMALDYIGMLRAAVAADPTHPRAIEVVGELSIRSAEFRRMWAQHDVREAVRGTKTFRHRLAGDIAFDWDTYPLPGNPGPVMIVYTAEPQILQRLRSTAAAIASAPLSLGCMPSPLSRSGRM
ncbi:helix-turn-helix transcriptional regulator [Actinoplanes sp. NPDC051343]|jgi:transcriptional regulator with XRE-family HTH domain|uniref:helix-turn-helix transcriptional regulator n=1 Tax=Actinoplanes sp. NPDC051343 TaxID=3363906 RepID=UPI0037AB750F